MAAVRVFVDDAVLGELPPVCLKTGKPADMVVASTRPVGGQGGAWWLLLLLGPAGFVALVVIALVRTGAVHRSGALHPCGLGRGPPAAQPGAHEHRHGVRVAGHGPRVPEPVPAHVGAGRRRSVVAGLAMWAVASSRQVGISLDGSRRWVTFWRVHPDFARAVRDREPSIRGAGR